MRVARAVRQVILANELAGTRYGLGKLIGWLGQIADDFDAHGADVDDIRWEIRRLERELRRRGGATILAIVLAVIAACSGEPTTPRPQMQLIADNRTTDTLIVWWWWKDVTSAQVGAPVVIPPAGGNSRCVAFAPVAWAQIEGAQGSHDRNSSAGDWRSTLITIDPARTSYWLVVAAGSGQPPVVWERPDPVC